jgi:hypothetical protein
MWTRANLNGIGALGDAALAGSCVPAPGSYNGERVICGGIYFDNVRSALTWPGAAILRDVPTVTNTLADPNFPVSMPLFGMESGPTGPLAATPAQAKAYSLPIGPATLVSPLPSITPVHPDKVTESAGSVVCGINQFVSGYPMLAALAALGVYWLCKGGKR